ncbi:MAG: ABC transporter permease [Defluviitaleaceae bacterium]|nr:ABC transporter permease [Defluviitaleaceae bacterium]
MNLTVFKYSLRRGFLSPFSLIANCLLPVLAVIFLDDGFYILATSFMFGAFFMARGIQRDKIDGVVIRILAGPVTMRDYLVQNFFAAMIPMIGIIAIVCTLGVVIRGWGLLLAIPLALCYALLAATFVGLSFVWSCLFKDKESSVAVFTVLAMTAASIGGLTLPLEMLPTAIFYLGVLFPSHWAARAIGILLNYGITPMYWVCLLALILFAAAYLLYGGKRRII